jgi:nucleotide-binding universal stress UspA family protein
MRTILVAIDSSDIADAVVSEAAALARGEPARLILLTVVQPPVITSEYAPYVENLAEIAAVGERSAKAHLDRLQQQLAAGGITAETVQLDGAPVPHILEQAKKVSADYIVMGSHGHTAFYDLLVGSTTHGVLLRTTCPVVIVPKRVSK